MSFRCEDVLPDNSWTSNLDIFKYEDFDTLLPSAEFGDFGLTSLNDGRIDFWKEDSPPDKHFEHEHSGAFVAPPFIGLEEGLRWDGENSSPECFSTDAILFTVDDYDHDGLVEEQRRARCGICNERFKNAYSLEQHAKSSGHRTYDCKVPGCDRSYCRRDLLIRHRKTHELEHMCPVCAENRQMKTFKRKDHLQQHYRNCHPNSPLPSAKTTATGLSRRPILDLQTSSKTKFLCPRNKNGQSANSQKDSGAEQLRSEDTDGKSSSADDLDTAMQKEYGESLRESLDLSKTSTTGELVSKIQQLKQQKPLA